MQLKYARLVLFYYHYIQTTAACHVLQRLQGGVGREALADAARPGVADAVGAAQAAGECGTNMCGVHQVISRDDLHCIDIHIHILIIIIFIIIHISYIVKAS